MATGTGIAAIASAQIVGTEGYLGIVAIPLVTLRFRQEAQTNRFIMF